MKIKSAALKFVIIAFSFFIFFFALVAICFISLTSEKIKLASKPPSFIVCDKNSIPIFIYSKNENEMGYWKLKDEIPERLKKTILAAEDKRFYGHFGIDFLAVFRAVCSNMNSRKIISGASTIPMQVARMQNSSRRNFFNKTLEAITAAGLIIKFGREKILKQYLTMSPFGARIYGAGFASALYFNKPIEDLTFAESAILAAIPKSPAKYNLYSNKGVRRTIERAKKILKALNKNGEISKEEYLIAINDLNDFIKPPAFSRNVLMIHPILEMKKKLDENYETILKQIESGKKVKYVINSSVDMDLQKEIDYIVKTEIEKFRKAGAENCSLIIADKETGGIRVYIGSADYFDEFYSGSINYNSVYHSPGSALKPFVYAAGIKEKNYSGATQLTDVGLILSLKNGIYAPQNYNRNFLGPITYRFALGNSRNIPAIEVINDIGLDKIAEYLYDFGVIDNPERVKNSGLSLAVGGLYVPLEKLLNAYGILASDGLDFKSSFFDGYFDKPRRRIIDEDIARQITSFLSDPLARLPTFERLGNLEYNFPAAVKTGTSNGYRDALVSAYTNKYVICAWIGTKNNTPMNRLTGENSAAFLLSKIMPLLHKEDYYSLNIGSFPEPSNMIKKKVCLLSGKLACPDCQSVACEWFNKNNIPKGICDIHKKIELDIRTDMPAEKDCPEQFRITKNYIVFPERFADWAKSSGYALLPDKYKNENFQENVSRYIFQKNNITINEPANQTKIFIDYDTPEEFRTLALKTTVAPSPSEIVWYVDNKPYCSAKYPYSTRWKLSKGSHSVFVKIPDSGVSSKTHYFFVD